ncbi:ABC transporter ATP-binding protein [uncultured Ruthenibacterium sp.]|uniref:ABC transporter ATP-binding protein n=1 Tax=uncultured Ruthenibacterium sp. TaxID=1905347 RepID=UPI00349E7C36
MILGPLFKLTEAILELMIPLLMADIIDVGIRNGDRGYVVTHGLFMLSLGAIGLVCALICQYFAAVCAQGFGRSLRKTLFRHIFSLSQKEYGTIGTDSLITRLTSDVNQVQTGVNMFIRLAVRAPFLTGGSIVMALLIDWKIGLIFLVSTPLIVLVLYVIMSRSVPYYLQIQKGQDRISRLAGENLEGARVIRAFSRQKSEVETFDVAGDDLAKTTVYVGKISAALNPITSVIVNLAIVAIVWFGARFTDMGILEQGQIIALVNYMTQTLLALIVLANIIVVLTRAVASARRIAQVLEQQTSMQDVAESQKALSGSPYIEFENVSFRYHSGGDEALEKISFQVDKGWTLGIIGGTGCGKTTLARLLAREYDVTAGKIKIEGVDIRDYTLADLHQKIGLVPQTAMLFSGTIRSNLKLGNETADDTVLWKALDTAQGAEFVHSKPDGLDTVIEEGGKNLSGGQKQRLTIARALAKQPQILILDDSASALDYATDAALRKALRRDTRGMTVVMISQRASTIKNADRILVLDDGRMCGYGTHEQLLNNCEVYREICRSQKLLSEEGVQ